MDKTIDLTFYHKVKAKFSTVPGALIFISLTSENVDDLVPLIFKKKEFDAYYEYVKDHCINSKPYAIVTCHSNYHTFYFACKEFQREENLDNGKLLEFRLDPFRKLDLNTDAVRADLAKLGELLFGNSKAS